MHLYAYAIHHFGSQNVRKGIDSPEMVEMVDVHFAEVRSALGKGWIVGQIGDIFEGIVPLLVQPLNLAHKRSM